MKALSLFALMLSATSAALAHEGHGLTGPHWHATDVVGYVGAALVAAGAWWMTRRK
jgi:hypothetical protein